MHYSLEIITPPVADVEAAIGEILLPFSENEEDANYAFWDWWQIGGRYSGGKTEAVVDPERLQAFKDELTRRKVTVSGLICGKQELQPASQIEMVDALWRDMCPGAGRVCPMFKHSGERSSGDICTFKDLPPALKAYKVIFAAPDYEGKKLEAVSMFTQSIWNGVTHEDTKWDGTVASAIAMHRDKFKNYKKEYAEKVTPRDDWMVVTVDYHS